MGAAASLLAGFAVLFVIALVVLNRNQEHTIREVTRARAASAAASELVRASVDVETGQRGYLLTRDRVFLGPYAKGKTTAAARLAALARFVSGEPQLGGDAEAAKNAIEAAIAEIDHTLDLDRAHTLSGPQLRDQLLQSKAAMDLARARAEALTARIDQMVETKRAANAASRSGIYTLGGLLGGLAIIAVGLSFWLLRQERRAWAGALAASEEAKAVAEIAREKAAASDRAKTQFLAVASHDMRQPLHALTLYLSALQRRVDSPEAKDIVAKMERAANSLVSMFAALLDLARIQADVINPEIEEFALQDAIDRVIGEHPDARVVGPSPPSELTVRTDPMLFDRVLRNLVANAIRHGGGAAFVAVAPVNGKARVSVSDRGPGIAEADQQRIFEEFTRLDGRAGAEGLGLGLAIVKRIAEVLDFALEVRSAPGEGASFSISVPIVAMSAEHHSDTAGETTLQGACVLVLDDDALALTAVAGVLRDAGANVFACANETDLNAAVGGGKRPDLLVMDLRIEGKLRGVEIAKSLRARLAPPPPVIMVTGDTGADTLGLLRDSGFAWLIKPVDRATLTSSAAEQLRKAPSLT
jgi:signal transduction histidine kinase